MTHKQKLDKVHITIKDLAKNDQFNFNMTLYTVKRKYINDDKPLIATYGLGGEDLFHYEYLEVAFLGNAFN